MIRELLASIALIWYVAVVVVCAVGYVQLFRHLSRPPAPAKCLGENFERPHVTVIRPIKGLEPELYQCLASTFRQTYPREKLTVFFCVESRSDPSFPTLQRLLNDFPDFDVSILVEEEDPELLSGRIALGPNPKIRNMTRAYREAKGDLIWIIDCNVWVGKGAAGRMVDTLTGFRGRKNKFVHLLPLVVDSGEQEQNGANGSAYGAIAPATESHGPGSTLEKIWNAGGGRLEELFMSSSHAKFYTAINTVLIAPCVVGKSTMFRRSHLDHLTSRLGTLPHRSPGIDFFSDNICEDHLIGDLLWKNNVPEEDAGEHWGKHALVFGDLAMQPMAGMSVREYVARRVRWLRVRKFTVIAATLVEHGTESVACSLYGAFAITTLPWFSEALSVPPTWTSFALFLVCSLSLWCLVDWTLYIKLHSAASIEVDDFTPRFARPPAESKKQTGLTTRRSFPEWFLAWCGRELMAFPIWSWAVFGGGTVVWRGKKMWVGMDMVVYEVDDKTNALKRKRRAS